MTRAIRQWFLDRSLSTKLILVFSPPLLLLVGLSTLTLLTFDEFDSAERLVLRSNHIQAQTVSYRELVASMQNAFRGYVITGDKNFLALYQQYKGDLDLAGFELERLVKDSPLQSQRDLVVNAQTLTRILIKEKDRNVDRLHAGKRDEVVSYIKSRRGHELVEQIYSLLNLFQSVASQILNERQTAVEHKRDLLLGLIIGGTFVTLLVTVLGLVVVARSVTKPMADLAAAAAEIGESRLAVFQDTNRRDEVGVLSKSMEEMQRRLAPAERLAAMTRMATSIAHDLRTPLLGIEQGLQGFRYITDAQLNAEARRLLGDLHTGARLAVGIVQDILDLYRQAYGELPLSFSRFALDDLANEAIELMGAEARDRRLSVSVKGHAPAVWADRRRLFRVLINLLDNAIKNSPTGGHVGVVLAERGGDSFLRAVVAIEDEGSGLDPTAIETLFEPSRPISAPTRSGTGLGLYLCRLVIGAHQGTISAENRPEGGARFAFDIPVEEPHGHPAPDRRRPTPV
jgi:signal transduction histidine kinase